MKWFFTGLHQPSDAGRVPAGCISVVRLRDRRRRLLCAPDWPWIMDSGAFSTILAYGGYRTGVSAYATEIRRWRGHGDLLTAVAQDYMCEPAMVMRTGLSIAEHQRLTIERYDRLTGCDTGGVPIMPVLQGYAAKDYVAHVDQYGERLRPDMWVGVGTLCKRNGSPAAIEAVLLAIKRERPELRLHGFGIKTTALASGLVRDLLYSADSLAWSYHARLNARGRNDWREAARFARRIATMPQQLSLVPTLTPPLVDADNPPGKQRGTRPN